MLYGVLRRVYIFRFSLIESWHILILRLICMSVNADIQTLERTKQLQTISSVVRPSTWMQHTPRHKKWTKNNAVLRRGPQKHNAPAN